MRSMPATSKRKVCGKAAYAIIRALLVPYWDFQTCVGSRILDAIGTGVIYQSMNNLQTSYAVEQSWMGILRMLLLSTGNI